MTSAPISSMEGAVSPLRDFQFASAWLAGDDFAKSKLPAVKELLEKRLSAIKSDGWMAWDAEEIEELAEFNRACGNAAGVKLAQRLSDPNALVVVTGQQPDLLASPLYVLYKALSAVAWARRLSAEYSRDVTPVFWVASDDDDFGELKQAELVAWNGDLIDAGRRISRGNDVKQGAPAYDWNLSESDTRIQSEIDRALAGWPGGEISAEWLRAQIAEEPSFEGCFCRLMAVLLGGDFGMLFVAPRLQSVRRRGAKVLGKDLRGHSQVNQAVMAVADQFQDHNFPVTLARDEAALNFFWLQNDRRQRLLRLEDDQISVIDPVTRKESNRFSEAELQNMLSETPGAFAPNVVTRPVVQDLVLPSAMYVAGPGEMAYLALLGDVYTQYGVTRSAVAPRAMIVLHLEDGFDGGSEAGEMALSQDNRQGRDLLEELTALSREIDQRLNALRAAANGGGPGIDLAVEKTAGHMHRGLVQLRRRLARQVAPEAWNRIARRKAIVEPAGKPQERVLAPWNFVKAGEWDALAHHVFDKADLTVTGPHYLPVPEWLAEAL